MASFQELKVPLLQEKVKLLNEYSIDDFGRVFSYDDKIFRGIYSKAAPIVAACFQTGLVDKLNERGLIPHTTIEPYTLPGYSFVLGHEKVDPVSYVFEWSFTMVKDAAVMVLDVLEELLKHGFTLKDAHPHNVLFKHNKPVWVDFTSFTPGRVIGSSAVVNFIGTLYQPLDLMSVSPRLMRLSRQFCYTQNSLLDIATNAMYKWGFKTKRGRGIAK